MKTSYDGKVYLSFMHKFLWRSDNPGTLRFLGVLCIVIIYVYENWHFICYQLFKFFRLNCSRKCRWEESIIQMDEDEDEMETVHEWCVHLQSKSEDGDVHLDVGDKCDDDSDTSFQWK